MPEIDLKGISVHFDLPNVRVKSEKPLTPQQLKEIRSAIEDLLKEVGRILGS